MGILDSAGNLVVEYYRGYVFDEETGLYCLNSRYFSPLIGRFLILDEYVVGSSGDVLNHNAYIYCGNNPIARVDEDGNWFLSCLIGAAVSVAFEYVNDVVENFQKGERGLEAFKPDSPASHYIAAGVGGFIAAIPGGTYVRTAAVGAISNVADKAIRGDIKSSADVIETAMIGGYSNAAGRYISEYVVAGKAVKKINKQNRATRKQYARKIYGGKNSNINTNLRRLAVEAGPAYADAHKYRYGAYSSMASTGLINYVMIK